MNDDEFNELPVRKAYDAWYAQNTIPLVGHPQLDAWIGWISAWKHKESEFTSLRAALAEAGKVNNDSPTWPHVLAFAMKMEEKLSLNRHKGDAAGWRKDSTLALHERACEELDELAEAINFHENGPSKPNSEWVVGEAADVANFAMMIADVAALSKKGDGDAE